MASGPAIQDVYPETAAHCYGCGRLNESGHQLKTYLQGEDTVSHFTPEPYHTAVPGYVYGGLIASLIDCHATATASAATERAAGREIGQMPAPRFVTASLSVDYLRPTPLGPRLEIRGSVAELTERKAVIKVTVAADTQVTARGQVIVVPLPRNMQ